MSVYGNFMSFIPIFYFTYKIEIQNTEQIQYTGVYNMPTAPVATFRVTVTAQMVNKIVELARTEQPFPSTISLEILGKFAGLKGKIDNNAINPAYTTAPAISKLESLGGISQQAPSTAYTLAGTSYSTKEEYWEACYKLYAVSPELCDMTTIMSGKEHAYLNDLMTEEEIAEFEAGAI